MPRMQIVANTFCSALGLVPDVSDYDDITNSLRGHSVHVLPVMQWVVIGRGPSTVHPQKNKLIQRQLSAFVKFLVDCSLLSREKMLCFAERCESILNRLTH